MGKSLSIENIAKNFKDICAVNSISFNVEPGEMFALLGPSGAGKSTTVNLIAGIEKIDSGDIKINGKSVIDVKPQYRDIAMVFESYAIYPNLTVFENMAFPLKSPMRANKYTKKNIESKIYEIAEILEITELLQRYPKELSGGQKQRVGLGRALVRDTDLFLLDEPIAHLDAKLRHTMRSVLKRLQKKYQRTTVLATPDYNEVVAMADRAAILDHGEIRQIGTPVDLYNNPDNVIVSRSIGDPPINLLDAEVVTENNIYFLIGSGFRIQVDKENMPKIFQEGKQKSRNCTIGIRPLDIIISRDTKKTKINTEVYIQETLGNRDIISLSVNGYLIKVLTDNEERYKIGEKIGIDFHIEKLFYFDKETKNRIR